MPLTLEQIKRLAGLELNALRLADSLGEEFEGARLAASATEVFDLNGSTLFHRIPLTRGRTPAGYADVAADEALGEPLLSVAVGAAWDEKSILTEAAEHARKGRRSLKFDKARFVAFSYPKVAVQFLFEGREVLMLEWGTWAEVPARQSSNRKPLEPGNFERWSLLDELPTETKRSNARAFAKRQEGWDTPALKRLDPSVIRKDLLRIRSVIVRLVDTRELHYSRRSTDHHPCYELRGQQTNVWCVAASAEMMLNFYRYEYNQVRLAQELGLGTLANPNGLPYARVGDVVTVLERLACLDVTMVTNPAWSVFQNEIRDNRPLISFVPGHSRTVAGYTRHLIGLPAQLPFRGLLVYDPWPPNVGVITKWENFATQTYQYAYSAVLNHV
jgi:hypothetical protein